MSIPRATSELFQGRVKGYRESGTGRSFRDRTPNLPPAKEALARTVLSREVSGILPESIEDRVGEAVKIWQEFGRSNTAEYWQARQLVIDFMASQAELPAELSQAVVIRTAQIIGLPSEAEIAQVIDQEPMEPEVSGTEDEEGKRKGLERFKYLCAMMLTVIFLSSCSAATPTYSGETVVPQATETVARPDEGKTQEATVVIPGEGGEPTPEPTAQSPEVEPTDVPELILDDVESETGAGGEYNWTEKEIALGNTIVQKTTEAGWTNENSEVSLAKKPDSLEVWVVNHRTGDIYFLAADQTLCLASMTEAIQAAGAPVAELVVVNVNGQKMVMAISGIVPLAILESPGADGSKWQALPAEEPYNDNATFIASANSNVRLGPGTNYPIVDNLKSGDLVNIIAISQTQTGEWAKIKDGKWVLKSLLELKEAEPVQPVEPTPTDVPPTTVPVEVQPTPTTLPPTEVPAAPEADLYNIEALGYREVINKPGSPPLWIKLGGSTCAILPDPSFQWSIDQITLNPEYVHPVTGEGAQETLANVMNVIFDTLDNLNPSGEVPALSPDDDGYIYPNGKTTMQKWDRTKGIAVNMYVGKARRSDNLPSTVACPIGNYAHGFTFGIVDDGPNKGQIWINMVTSEELMKTNNSFVEQLGLEYPDGMLISNNLRPMLYFLLQAQGDKFTKNSELQTLNPKAEELIEKLNELTGKVNSLEELRKQILFS